MDDTARTGWFHRGKKQLTDSQIFENLTRCIFQAGLNWDMVAKKWPAFTAAFDGFDVVKVAGYGAYDINRLMNDPGIIRNRAKVLATIHNAREFERLRGEEGGFPKWLAAQDKSNNCGGLIRMMGARFKFVGPTTGAIFLYSIGEDVVCRGWKPG